MNILNQMPPYNLFGLEEQDYPSSRIAAFPIPYDSTVTYRSGAREGPSAIINASRNMELYNDELGITIPDNFVFTMEPIAPDLNSPTGMISRIEKEVSIVIDEGKIPFLLGGEHTISLGSIRALASKSPDFSILHLDAHSDSRDEIFGTKNSHASIMARARELVDSCYSVGVRSIDADSMSKYSGDIMFSNEIHLIGISRAIKRILNRLKDKVYVTVDLDVLDPSEMPSVGTPEPDGLSYAELKSILHSVFSSRKIVGFDVTELCPIPGFIAPDFLAAKLSYSMVCYMYMSEKKQKNSKAPSV
ncbi:MAG: agmatinase [Candidatus Micrarchaeaceae archaeon]